MAVVSSMEQALFSRDRFNLIQRKGLGWEIHDNRDHRTVSMHFDEQEARAAYERVIQ